MMRDVSLPMQPKLHLTAPSTLVAAHFCKLHHGKWTPVRKNLSLREQSLEEKKSLGLIELCSAFLFKSFAF
jgi:hypothetical protein